MKSIFAVAVRWALVLRAGFGAVFIGIGLCLVPGEDLRNDIVSAFRRDTERLRDRRLLWEAMKESKP